MHHGVLFPDADWPQETPSSSTFSGENVGMVFAPVYEIDAGPSSADDAILQMLIVGRFIAGAARAPRLTWGQFGASSARR